MRGRTWARCANCGQATYRCAANNCTPSAAFAAKRLRRMEALPARTYHGEEAEPFVPPPNFEQIQKDAIDRLLTEGFDDPPRTVRAKVIE